FRPTTHATAGLTTESRLYYLRSAPRRVLQEERMLGNLSGLAPALVAVAVLAVLILVWLTNALRYIPNNRVGIVEKVWSAKGSVTKGFIALQGEAGFQPDVLRRGRHAFFPTPYRVPLPPPLTIP